ncbi:MAG: hypothetical protein GY948_24580 [Alphaproteobacteria bacterium]|nr:hypothetical protein [Alphaproteobacteria bacterium]
MTHLTGRKIVPPSAASFAASSIPVALGEGTVVISNSGFTSIDAGSFLTADGIFIMLLETSGTRASADTEKSAAAVRRAAAALVLCVILKTFNVRIDDARSTSHFALLIVIESNFSFQLKPILK